MLREDKQPREPLDDPNDSPDKPSERRTITRRELARAVSAACNAIPQSRAGALVDEVLEEIAGALVAGQNVTLCNFGKFVLVEKKERKGRNPRTGELAVVRSRRVATFRPARHLKATIAKLAPGKADDDD